MKIPKYHQAFANLGEAWKVVPEVCDELESFVYIMFGYSHDSTKQDAENNDR